MTTGARLVELSRLPAGTALAHLLAIRAGAGTRFAAEIRLAIGQGEIVVSEVRGENLSLPLTPECVGVDEERRAVVFTAPEQLAVLTVADRLSLTLTLTQRLKQDLFIHTL